MKILYLLCVCLLLTALTACSGRRGLTLEDLPTQATFSELATADFLTQNAPPPGFRESVSFPRIDDNLDSLPGWHYTVTLEFDGVFARTPREAQASAQADVWYNQLGSARRVVVETVGELLGVEENLIYEAVRLGPDAFLVRDGICLSNAGADAETAADLRAGALVGGVERAVPTGRRAVINGAEVWEYRFDTADLRLPSIRIDDNGRINATGELWVAPEHNAVVRFYVNLEVENAYIFDRQLPVSGQVIQRYDVFDIGTAANITVPFGC